MELHTKVQLGKDTMSLFSKTPKLNAHARTFIKLVLILKRLINVNWLLNLVVAKRKGFGMGR